jgi:hypothetical protein
LQEKEAGKTNPANQADVPDEVLALAGEAQNSCG